MSKFDRMDEQLHQTMGQELLYLLLAISVTASLILAVISAPKAPGHERKAADNDQPPIITLSEAEGYSFTSGSVELSPQFLDRLHGPISDQLATIVRKYNANVIEVVGHTDEVHVKARHGSLDQTLLSFLAGDDVNLAFADNAGLGMARAAVVERELRKDQRFKDIKFVPLSGAQATPPDGEEHAGQVDAARLRRVEIRARR